MEEDNKIRLEKINKRAGLAFKIIVVFILANASLIIFFDTEKSGQIGDTFGAVNAFFFWLCFCRLGVHNFTSTQRTETYTRRIRKTKRNPEKTTF